MARWEWQCPSAGWKAYTHKQCEKIESAFARNVLMVKVDAKRYISFEDSPWVQRLYSGSAEEREVRRVALGNVKSNGAAGGGEVEQHSCLFQAHVFYTFPSSLSVPQWTELCGVISDNGGLVAARANNRVWHAREVTIAVVGNEELSEEDHEVYKEWVSRGGVAVRSGYVEDCAARGTLLDFGEYLYQSTGATLDEKEISDEENSGSHMDVESDAQKGSTKNKGFKAGSVLEGVCYRPIPFELHIEQKRGSRVSGLLKWPNSAISKCKGTITGKHISLEEFEALEGGNGRSLPSVYIGTVSGEQASGEVEEDGRSGRWELSLPPA